MEISSHVYVVKVMVANRADCCGERFENVGIHVGNDPAVVNVLTENPICSIFAGPSTTGAMEEINCNGPRSGKFIIVQRRNPGDQDVLQIAELYLYGTALYTGIHITACFLQGYQY